jgi:RHS repeat-associated protein
VHIPPQNTPGLTFSNAKNRADQFVYDNGGNVSNDGSNAYLYDGDNRICAVKSSGTLTGYLYDADGRRVAKGSLTSFSCDLSVNGFTATERYVLGQSGEQLMAVNGSGNWEHTNVFAGGKLLGTFDAGSDGFHYAFSDWLGTKRAQYSLPHGVESLCSSLPYGDSLSCTGADATNHHFTGKERDIESNNDYFGARYYGAALGRFMSPDDGADSTLGVPVPFSDLENPQSLNLYSYVVNNPLSLTDPDGQAHWGNCNDGSDAQCLLGDYNGELMKQNGRTVFWNAGHGYWDEIDPTGRHMDEGRVIPGDLGIGFVVGSGVGRLAGAGIRGALGAITDAVTARMGQAVAEGGAKTLLSGGTKQAAKEVIDGLAEGAQKASAKRAVAAATKSESVSISQAGDGTVTVTRTRPGFEGSQTFTKTIDSAGNSTTVQTAHDAAGNLVHYDPKN